MDRESEKKERENKSRTTTKIFYRERVRAGFEGHGHRKNLKLILKKKINLEKNKIK